VHHVGRKNEWQCVGIAPAGAKRYKCIVYIFTNVNRLWRCKMKVQNVSRIAPAVHHVGNKIQAYVFYRSGWSETLLCCSFLPTLTASGRKIEQKRIAPSLNNVGIKYEMHQRCTTLVKRSKHTYSIAPAGAILYYVALFYQR